jgi:hypothetical protein
VNPRGAERARAVALGADERPHQAVLGPGRELHGQLDAALDPLHQAQQLVRRAQPQVVAALAVGHRERVGQPHDAGRRAHGRLEHERARQVAALGRLRPDGAQRPVAGGGVEDAGEQGRAVEPRQAQPLDRTGPVDERRRVAVRE